MSGAVSRGQSDMRWSERRRSAAAAERLVPERERKCQQGDSRNTLDNLKWQTAISPAAGQHDLAAMESGCCLEGALNTKGRRIFIQKTKTKKTPPVSHSRTGQGCCRGLALIASFHSTERVLFTFSSVWCVCVRVHVSVALFA